MSGSCDSKMPKQRNRKLQIQAICILSSRISIFFLFVEIDCFCKTNVMFGLVPFKDQRTWKHREFISFGILNESEVFWKFPRKLYQIIFVETEWNFHFSQFSRANIWNAKLITWDAGNETHIWFQCICFGYEKFLGQFVA